METGFRKRIITRYGIDDTFYAHEEDIKLIRSEGKLIINLHPLCGNIFLCSGCTTFNQKCTNCVLFELAPHTYLPNYSHTLTRIPTLTYYSHTVKIKMLVKRDCSNLLG